MFYRWGLITEERSRHRDEMETPKASTEERHGEGLSLPQPTTESGGAYPSGVRGRVPAETGSGAFGA